MKERGKVKQLFTVTTPACHIVRPTPRLDLGQDTRDTVQAVIRRYRATATRPLLPPPRSHRKQQPARLDARSLTLSLQPLFTMVDAAALRASSSSHTKLPNLHYTYGTAGFRQQ